MKNNHGLFLMLFLMSVVMPVKVWADVEVYDFAAFAAGKGNDTQTMTEVGALTTIQYENENNRLGTVSCFKWSDTEVLEMKGRLATFGNFAVRVAKGTNPNRGLQNVSGNDNRVLAILHLYEGDRVTIEYSGDVSIFSNNAVNAATGSSVLVSGEPYIMQSNGFLGLRVRVPGANNTNIRKITIETPAKSLQFTNKKVLITDGRTTYQNGINDTSGVTYHCEGKGDLKDNVSISKEGKVDWTAGKSGAIVVTALHPTYGRAQYVITVPYKTHEWVFNTTEDKESLYQNTVYKNEWALAWKVYKHTDGTPQYYTQLEHPVFSNANPVDGDNARFIDATAGLLFSAPVKSFGTNVTVTPPYYEEETIIVDKTEKKVTKWGVGSDKKEMGTEDLSNFLQQIHGKYNLDQNVEYNELGASVTIQTGTTLTIPNLKKGQYVRFRWNCHDDKTNTGDKWIATNVTDLAHKRVSTFYTGSGSNANSAQAHQEFIVAENGDVSFTLQGTGWANIFNIVVADGFVDTDLNIATVAVDKDSITYYNVPNEHKELSYNGHAVLYTYLRKAGEEPITTKFTTARGQVHLQSSLDLRFEIEGRTGTLTPENCYLYTAAEESDKEVNNVLYIAPNAHGSFTLIEKGVTNTARYSGTDKYMLDSLRVKVEVYEFDYNVKPYPYTWAMENFGETIGGITTDAQKSVSLTDKQWRYWDEWASGNDPTYRYRIGTPECMIAWKARTDGRHQGSVSYKMNTGEKMVAGQTIPVKDGAGDVVALVIYGERSVDANGKKVEEVVFSPADAQGQTTGYKNKKGAFYTIIPKYDGTIALTVGANAKVQENNAKDITVNNGSFFVKEGQHYKVYADQNANLSFGGFSYSYNQSGEFYIPELDGLGIMPTEYWNEKDEGLLLKPFQKGLCFGERGYQLKVPNVQKGQTVYLAVTDDTDNSSVAVGGAGNYISYNGKIGYVYEDMNKQFPVHIYEIQGQGGDVDLYLKNMTLHKVAVSVDKKSIKDIGYATEAREYPLDVTLAQLFCGKELRAYKVDDVEGDYVKMKGVQYIPMTVDGRSEEYNGIVLAGENTDWPLFTPDINRMRSDMSGNQLKGVVAQANIDENVEQSEKVGDTSYYHYMLSNKGYSVAYDSEEDAKSPDKPGSVVGNVEGVGFYLVLKTGTDMGNGSKYPGGKPKDHSSYLRIDEWRAKRNPMSEVNDRRRANVNAAGIHQVFFIDTDGLVTEIEDVEVDGTTTEGNAGNFEDGVFYTLQGVAVKAPTKGFYIFNGKKVYITK